MNLRKTLDELKPYVDSSHLLQSGRKSGAKVMTLYEPAPEDVIQAFLANGWSKPLPPSYGGFLRATDGLDNGWDMLSFVGTDKGRQKSLLTAIKYILREERESMEAVFGDCSPETIAKWEKSRSKLFLGDHAIIAADRLGSALAYDGRTIKPTGEMELVWIPGTSGGKITRRFPSVQAYFESILQEAKKAKSK